MAVETVPAMLRQASHQIATSLSPCWTHTLRDITVLVLAVRFHVVFASSRRDVSDLEAANRPREQPLRPARERRALNGELSQSATGELGRC
jgi:hypothetical protein